MCYLLIIQFCVYRWQNIHRNFKIVLLEVMFFFFRTKPICCQREAMFKERPEWSEGIRSAFCEYSCRIGYPHLRHYTVLSPVFQRTSAIRHVLFIYAVHYFIFLYSISPPSRWWLMRNTLNSTRALTKLTFDINFSLLKLSFRGNLSWSLSM